MTFFFVATTRLQVVRGATHTPPPTPINLSRVADGDASVIVAQLVQWKHASPQWEPVWRDAPHQRWLAASLPADAKQPGVKKKDLWTAETAV